MKRIMRKKKSIARHDITCPNCAHSSTVRIEGEGFKSIACRKCSYLIHDLDKYFNIVYGGENIIPIKEHVERGKHIFVGTVVMVLLALLYMAWVTMGLYLTGLVAVYMPLVVRPLIMALVFIGLPYITYKKVLT
jgi:hypothetical protein